MSLEGRLEDLGLTDVFQIIGLSKRSGVLTIIRKEGTGRLVFNNGQIVFASSDTRSRLGYSLVKKGIITNDELEAALRKQRIQGTKKPVGTILLEMGAITQADLEAEIRNHILSVVREMMGWQSGSFHFELGTVLEEDIVLKDGINTEFLLLEGARLSDEESRESTAVKSAPLQSQPARMSEPAGAMPISDPEMTQQVYSPPPAPKTSPVPKSSLPPVEPPPVRPAAPAEPPPGRGRKDLTLLAAMINELSNPSSSSEITLMILRFASELMNRAVLFLVRREDVIGLGQFGLVFHDGSPVPAQDRVRKIQIPLKEPSVFKDVVEQKISYKGKLANTDRHRYLIQELGGDWPNEASVTPLICDGKVIAVLYGDNLPKKESLGDTEGLEAFMRVAGVAFGKALLERKLHETRLSDKP